MKTIFEGKVNGVTYNSVEEYNKAIVEALKNGSVEASSQTRTVEDEPKSNIKFHGEVNGQVFDNVNDYNEAVKKVMDAGLPLNAYSETTQHDGTKSTDASADYNMEEDKCSEPDWLPGMNHDNYYMDSMTGEEERDKQIYESWVDYLKSVYTDIVECSSEFDVNSLTEYENELSDVIREICDDKKTTVDALNTMSKEKFELEEKLRSLNNSINVLNNALKLNKLFNEYYTQLHSYIYGLKNSYKVETNVKEIEPQKECPVNGIQKLLEEIFPNLRNN